MFILSVGPRANVSVAIKRRVGKRWVTYSILEVSDEVITIRVLLQASKGHLGARDVLFWVFCVVMSVPPSPTTRG